MAGPPIRTGIPPPPPSTGSPQRHNTKEFAAMLSLRSSVRYVSTFTSRRPRPPHVVLFLAAIAAAAYAATASADWVYSSGYIWNASAPFSLTVESHADPALTQMLVQSAADWSASGVASVSVASSGKVALYDGYYGTGMPCAWTQYWQHGGKLSHDAIYLNETCMASWSDYWKQYAICQELGHAIGLPDHNTTPTVASCMAPNMPSTTPSTDDFSELALLYGAGTTTSSKRGGGKGSGGPASTPLAGGGTTTSTVESTNVTTGGATDHPNANAPHSDKGAVGASHRP
jgi:hypothetical protein